MPRSPFQEWLVVQEHRRSRIMFLAEWMALFGAAWFFWSVIFGAGPGALSPGLAATLISMLYATSIVYGRVLRVTGCPRCRSPMPFRRKELRRRRLPDQEQCIEVEYGGEEWGQATVQVYCRVRRSDLVTYRCRQCEQVWEERVNVPGSGYKLVRRVDPKRQAKRQPPEA